MQGNSTINIVAAIGKNRELGKDGKLLWHIPEDLKRFRKLTEGHPMIMGRKTFESIMGYRGRPLPNRVNIVVTRNPSYKVPEGVLVFQTPDEALQKAAELDTEIHIGGGADLYRQVWPRVDKLYLTLIDSEAPDADIFFPEYENEFEKTLASKTQEFDGIIFQYVDFKRKPA